MKKHDIQFLTIKLLVQQFLTIHGSQIETKHIFGFVVIWLCYEDVGWAHLIWIPLSWSTKIGLLMHEQEIIYG
jgi:hypothetical protein